MSKHYPECGMKDGGLCDCPVGIRSDLSPFAVPQVGTVAHGKGRLSAARDALAAQAAPSPVGLPEEPKIFAATRKALAGGMVAPLNKLMLEHIDALRTAAEQRVGELEQKYHELIMAVARKYPNESRHETALRYINQAESNSICKGEADAKRS